LTQINTRGRALSETGWRQAELDASCLFAVDKVENRIEVG